MNVKKKTKKKDETQNQSTNDQTVEVEDTEDTQIKCNICLQEVKNEDDSLECSLCLTWIHKMCDGNITEVIYKAHIEDATLLFHCPSCLLLHGSQIEKDQSPTIDANELVINLLPIVEPNMQSTSPSDGLSDAQVTPTEASTQDKNQNQPLPLANTTPPQADKDKRENTLAEEEKKLKQRERGLKKWENDLKKQAAEQTDVSKKLAGSRIIIDRLEYEIEQEKRAKKLQEELIEKLQLEKQNFRNEDFSNTEGNSAPAPNHTQQTSPQEVNTPSMQQQFTTRPPTLAQQDQTHFYPPQYPQPTVPQYPQPTVPHFSTHMIPPCQCQQTSNHQNSQFQILKAELENVKLQNQLIMSQLSHQPPALTTNPCIPTHHILHTHTIIHG